MLLNNEIAGVLLAGGLSSRMGENKALLELEGQTQLDRGANLLEGLSLKAVYISGDYPKAGGITCIKDNVAQLGPIGGIYSCVLALSGKASALLILPVDMPFVTHIELQNLIDSGDGCGVYYQDAIFPLLIPISTELVDYLEQAISSDKNRDRSLYRLFRTLNYKALEGCEHSAFRLANANTPQEWREVKQRLEQSQK